MRDQIPELLKKNIFLSGEIKAKILAEHLSFDEEKSSRVVALLEAALVKQKSVIEKALKNNPNLLSEMKHQVSDEFMRQLREREAISQLEDHKELEKLEAELDSLFE